jgi:eukaryotic-like serine/threonine-protein kinase
MAVEPDDPVQDGRLYDVLLDYLESSERGPRPDSAEYLANHPEFAPALKEFFETEDRLIEMTATLHQTTPETKQATTPSILLATRASADAAVRPGPRSSGRTIGNYDVLEEVGRGGMGVVYKARDNKLGRLVAVKMIRSANHASAKEVARFLAEAKARARLDHRHIVPVYEIGEVDGLPYFVMAFVEGGSLQTLIANGPLPAKEAARLVQQAAEAIEHAHRRGVLHRDLKPHNILLDSENGAPRNSVSNGWSSADPLTESDVHDGLPIAKVSDFGLARLAEQDGITGSGEVLGTPSYMPPEQASGRVKDMGPCSDIYSLGAVLYCLVAGRPPFQAATVIETLRLVQDQDPVPPRRLNPAVTRDLEAVCLKCLEKEPRRRYARAADLVADLQRFLDGNATLARPLGRVGRSWRWAQRRPGRALTAAALISAVLGLVLSAVAYTLELRAHNEDLSAARANEQQQRLQAQSRGLLLQRKTYEDGIGRAAEARENLIRQIEDQNSGRPIPDILADLPGAEDCVSPAPMGGTAEDLRGFEWYFLRRLGNGLRAWRGHRRDPLEVTFSHDGHLAATAGGADKTARLWDPATGKELFRHRGRGDVNTVALAPDGHFVAISDLGEAVEGSKFTPGELQIWDWHSGVQVANLSPGAHRVHVTTFSPDGSLLAAVVECPDRSGAIILWDVGTWKQKSSWPFAAPGQALCFSADSRYLAEALSRGTAPATIRIHDLQTGTERAINPGTFADDIMRLAFAPKGDVLASGGFQGGAVLWDVATGLPRKDWKFPDKLISGLSFSANGKTLAIAAKTRAGASPARAFVQLWDTSTGQACSKPWGPGSLIHDIAYAPDGSVALACGDTMIRLWNPDLLEDSVKMPGSHKETWAVAFSPDGHTLASGGDDNKVRLWDIDRHQSRAPLSHPTLVSGVAFHPRGDFLVSVCYDGRIRLWDVASGSRLGSVFKGSDAAVRCVAFSPDGQTLATAGRDHVIRLWDVVTNSDKPPELRERVTMTGHTDDVLCLAFSPDGQLIASGGDDRTMRLWDARTDTAIRSIEEPVPVRAVAFAPDGKLAWGSDEGEVKLASPLADGPVTVFAGHAGRVRCVTFSADGRTLASAGDDKAVRLWQPTTGQPLLTLRGFDKPIYAASFAPGGRMLATGCYGGSVRLWFGNSVRP